MFKALNDYIEEITSTEGLSAEELIDNANDLGRAARFLRNVNFQWTVDMAAPDAYDLPAFLDAALDEINSKIQEHADYLLKQEQYFIDCAEETEADDLAEAGYIRDVSSLAGRI